MSGPGGGPVSAAPPIGTTLKGLVAFWLFPRSTQQLRRPCGLYASCSWALTAASPAAWWPARG